MLRIVVVALLLLNCTGAGAQSEEQTVAFIINGIESGKAIISGCGETHEAEIVTASPARYRFRCKNGTAADLVVSKLANCRYRHFWVEQGKEPEGASVLDFNKFQTLLPYEPRRRNSHFFLASPGFCEPATNCVDLFVSVDTGTCCAFYASDTPFERREKAISHLFKTFCGKGAF